MLHAPVVCVHGAAERLGDGASKHGSPLLEGFPAFLTLLQTNWECQVRFSTMGTYFRLILDLIVSNSV